MNNEIGKTFYYLLDEKNILHICSNGITACGIDAKAFIQVSDARLNKYPICEICKQPEVTKAKKATFETKAEIVESVTGIII